MLLFKIHNCFYNLLSDDYNVNENSNDTCKSISSESDGVGDNEIETNNSGNTFVFK